jgi:hypothetical protein
LIQINEVPNRAGDLTIVEQMSCGVQHHVRWTENVCIGSHLLRALEEPLGRRPQATRAGQDRVMNIDDRRPIAMHHRRQLVHPLAVVPVIVRIKIWKLPPTLAQQGLDPRKIRAWNEHVDISHAATDAWWQPRTDVRRTFEQNPPLAGPQKRASQPVDLPSDGSLKAIREGDRRYETILQPYRRLSRQLSRAALSDDPAEKPRGVGGVNSAAQLFGGEVV